MEAVASIVGNSPQEMRGKIDSYQKEQKATGHTPTMTESVYYFGISPKQWSHLRQEVWRPEAFLQPNPCFVAAVEKAARRFKVAFATNSPCNVGIRVLKCVGLNDQIDSGLVHVFGPEDCGISKHDTTFFQKVAKFLNLSPRLCLSIGDREKTEAEIAMKAGYTGAFIIENVSETVAVLENCLLRMW